MTPVDLSQVCQIEKRIHPLPWGHDIFHHCLWLNYRCHVMLDSDHHPQKIIGYCISRHLNNACHILNLAIDTPYQRKGLASQLLDELIDEVIAIKEIDHIILEVRPSNHAAINLYQKYGFQQAGVKEQYYKDLTGCEDAFILKRQLK